MESVKDNPITKTKNGEVITFIPKGEIEKARRELSVSGFDEGKFSDGELILAIRQKQSVGATTVIPVVLDWLIEKISSYQVRKQSVTCTIKERQQ